MNADIVNLDVLFEFFEPSEPDTIREFAASRLFHIARIIGEEVTSPTNSANCKRPRSSTTDNSTERAAP